MSQANNWFIYLTVNYQLRTNCRMSNPVSLKTGLRKGYPFLGMRNTKGNRGTSLAAEMDSGKPFAAAEIVMVEDSRIADASSPSTKACASSFSNSVGASTCVSCAIHH